MTNNDSLLRSTLDAAARYGVREDNPLCLAPYTHEDLQGEVDLDDPELVRIDRLRLLGDSDGWVYPFLDLSYCYGTLRDGSHVRVILPETRFSKKNLKGDLIAMARKAGVYAKGLGLLDNISRLY